MILLGILYWTLVFLSIGTIDKSAHATWTSDGEKAIRGSKLNTATYDRLVRPVETVAVQAGLHLMTIDTLDIKSMTNSMTGWLTVDWTDTRLTWTVDATNTAEHFYALDTEIWKPELFIDNSKENLKILNDPYLQFKVDKAGLVEWELPMIFQTHCEVDVTYYPFDVQICTVELTSWAYTKDELTLTALYDEVKTEGLEPHGEWDLVSTEVKTKDITETKASGTEQTYPVIDFNIKLRRKPAYYITGIILPVILVAFLQILVFLLPVDSGEKIGFAITVLLALAVLLTLVTDSMPSSAIHISYLSIYLALTLILAVFCVFATVLVVRTHFIEESIPIPKWVRKMMTCCCIPVSFWNGCCNKKSKVNPANNNDERFRFDSEDYVFSWKDVAAILDWFFFVMLLFVTSSLTLAVVLAILIGATTA